MIKNNIKIMACQFKLYQLNDSWSERYSYSHEDQRKIKQIIDNHTKCVILFSNYIEVVYCDNHEDVDLRAPALFIERHGRPINELWGCGMLSTAKLHYINSVCNNYQIIC